MAASFDKVVRQVAVLDALIVVLLVLSAMAALAVAFEEVVPWLALSIALPVLALFAAWRGAADARRVLRGDDDLRRPALEGFLSASSVALAVVLSGPVTAALAAGPSYPGLDGSAVDWASFLLSSTVWALIAGGIGAWLGILVGTTNRAVLRRAAI